MLTAAVNFKIIKICVAAKILVNDLIAKEN
jgi:hypothetical protein